MNIPDYFYNYLKKVLFGSLAFSEEFYSPFYSSVKTRAL
jgi:hypothetical protein